MAGIDKSVDKKETRKSIDEVKKEFIKLKEDLKKSLGKVSDRAEMSLEKRAELRKLYSQGALLAKELSDRIVEAEESDKFKDIYEKFSKKAEEYGSAIKHEIPETSFDDVKGLENVKNLVKSFIFMAENRSVMKYYGIKGNLGMLMYGAPGTGKTMFAEAVAHEMRLPLFVVTPADIFKSYVGASEQAVKLIFEEINACPDGAILFIDECESIFSKRTEGDKDYKAAVTTEFLQRMNGFGVDGSKRIMIAATNRPDEIDPAYLRYKRFSFLVHVTPPDVEAKRAIIKSKLKGIDFETPEDGRIVAPKDGAPETAAYGKFIDEILQKTNVTRERRDEATGTVNVERFYYSSADLCGVIEEACRIAIERIREAKGTTPIPLTMEMFDKAFEKIPPSISQELLNEYENFHNITK